MIMDILYYAKERELVLEPENINRFACEVAAAVEPKIAQHQIEFICDFDQAPREFAVDANFLRSALINILDNAVDACVEDRSKSTHKILFRIGEDNRHVVIEIQDNGIGMNAETRENIFELFYSSKGGKGTGFGLFIADNIVQQHGGSIVVNSVKGKGAHFSVKIPKGAESHRNPPKDLPQIKINHNWKEVKYGKKNTDY